MTRIELFSATCLGSALAAVFAQSAAAADAAPPSSSAQMVDELIVTATRRSEDVTKVPYNISAIGSAQVERAGIASFQDLTNSVPNLNLNASGGRSIGAYRPVIRGLNASASDRPGEALEQAAVASYLGNVPTPAGLFSIEDIERIEVLRGPQGSLYGAGALGGAIRIIPSAPKIGAFEGSVTGTAGVLSHSDDPDYGLSGVVNIPVNDTLAFRVSASSQRQAGFIDKIGVFVRRGNALTAPVLATPGDVAGSAAVLKTERDSNWETTRNARFSAKWVPVSALEVVAAYNISEIRGEGGPDENPNYPGGVDPLDPRLSYPATHAYQVIVRSDEPYKRGSKMGSLDISYDAGFATLSSTTSYTDTRGDTTADSSYGILRLPAGIRDYYIGSPANPRFNALSRYLDHSQVFTQEVRAVSKTDGPLQYVLGAYYQRDKMHGERFIYLPGQGAQTQAAGDPFTLGPGDASVVASADSVFTDKAVFGELTWHISKAWQVTGGARFFKQDFSRAIKFDIPLFFLNVTNANATSVNDSSFKLNTSYEFMPGQQVYATFSQGFRRGGANNFAIAGIVAESLSILDYRPDTVDNYEIGVKGRLGGVRYTFDFYDDEWKQPQIGIITPVNAWPVVVNGKAARSKGVEFEVSGAFADHFHYTLGYAYTDAKLTKTFCIPTGDGGGGFIACGVQGLAGTTLPGAPKQTASAELVYEREIFGGDHLELSMNANYKGAEFSTLPAATLFNPQLDGFWTVGANASWEHGPWRASVYARNLFDERGVLSVNTTQLGALLGPLDDYRQISRPRSIGAQVRYTF